MNLKDGENGLEELEDLLHDAWEVTMCIEDLSNDIYEELESRDILKEGE